MRAIFLDRDGVISKNATSPSGYVTKWEEFHFIAGSKKAIKKLTEAGFVIFIISNQGGVSKGIFTKKDLSRITKRMLKEIKEAGGKIKSVNYCIHKDEDNCSCRKPKTGLFKKATKGLRVNFKKAYFIGDAEKDIQAGKKVGCKTILVLSGKSKLKDKNNWQIKPDYVAKNLLDAVDKVVLERNRFR